MSIPAKKNPPRKRSAKLHHENAALVTLPESVRYTGFGLTLSYQKARAGKLPGAVMLDGRWYVNKRRLLAWLDSLGDTQDAA